MPLVTVSEVLRFAMPPGTRLLAGAEGLSNTVTWARSLGARPATLGQVEQGEVWLLSLGALQQLGEPRAVARLVRDVSNAGVVAFFVADALPPEALAEADRMALPVILLPAELPLGEAERSIVAFVVDRDRAIGQRVQEVYESLLATLIEDRGTELLAGIVQAETNKAVYLLDESLQPTVQAGGTPLSAAALADVRRRFWEGQLGNVSERLIALRPPDGAVARYQAALIRPLALRGAVEGYLALIGPRDDFGDFDRQIADRTASVLAIELAKQSGVIEARLRLQGDFLEELLSTTSSSQSDQLSARARALGYDLSQSYLVLVLRLIPERPQDGPPTPRQQQHFVDVARRRLVGGNVGSLVRESDGAVQVLLPCPPDLSCSNLPAVVAWAEQLRLEVEQGLAPDPVGVTAGIGRSPDQHTTFQNALREASQAADIAAGVRTGTRTLHFANLGALRLIFHLNGNPELEAFQRDQLGPLETYDRTGRSEFIQTLEAFLRAGGNHMQAARDLNVHRNTLIYRLERIRELLGGIDLEDADTRLNLQLALKIRSVIGTAA
jgi:PucR family transcriptional regulator, purine catabolism regulatory protein